MSTTTKNVGRVSIVPKGDWNINNTYIRLDLVTYDGNSYIAKKDVPKNIQLNNNGYWMLIASKGEQGERGEQGAPFAIVKSYASIAAMNADFSNTDVQNGQFVIIDTGNVQDPDNAKLYYKGSNNYVFVTDMSGAAGIQGPRGASAYEQAVAGGYEGTEAQFNEDLADFKELSEQAASSATAADNSAKDAEAYAIGKRGGTDVESTDLTYHNNAKYYSEQTALIVDDIEQVTTTTTVGPVAFATFEASVADMPLKGLTVDIEPVQDLHGYDHPWSEGGGKNLLPLTVSYLKEINKLGTWTNNSYVYNGVTFMVQVDSDGNVTGITVNGTASANAAFSLIPGSARMPVADGGYILNGCPSGGSGTKYRVVAYAYKPDGSFTTLVDYGSGLSIPSETYATFYCQITIFSGYAASNLVFQPMLRRTSETDATFEPYSNICSITGWTECKLHHTGVSLIGGDEFIGNAFVKNDGHYEITLGGSGLGSRGSGYVDITGLPAGQYTIECINYTSTAEDLALNFRYKKADGTYSNGQGVINSTYHGKRTITLPADATLFQIYILPDTSLTGNKFIMDDVVIRQADEASELYKGNVYDITFPTEAGTVYGGTLDVVNGVLKVTHAITTVSAKTWRYESNYTRFNAGFAGMVSGKYGVRQVPFMCSGFQSIDDGRALASVPNNSIYGAGTSATVFIKTDTVSTVEDFISTYGNVQIVFELAEPLVYDLTDIPELKTFIGANNIWADCDSVTVTYGAYLETVKFYADQAVDSAAAAEAVLASIPDDYTELSDKVDNLNTTFFAEYGVTTYNEIDTHVKDGNLVVLKQDGLLSGGSYFTVLSGTSFGEVAGFPWNGYIFTKSAVAFGDTVSYTKITCGSDNEWTTENAEVRNINTDIVGTFYYANAYNIGDYVQQNSRIYRFIVPHTAGSYWNTSEVVEVVLTNEIDKISEDVAELRSAIDKNNSVNILDNVAVSTSTTNGITFSVIDTQTINVAGTSTALANKDIYSSQTMPEWLEKGKQYYLEYSTPSGNVLFRVYIYRNGTLVSTALVEAVSNQVFTIPTDATGIIFRLAVKKSLTVNENVTFAVLNAKSNLQLSNNIENLSPVILTTNSADAHNETINLLNPNTITEGYVLSNNIPVANSSFYYSDYIEIGMNRFCFSQVGSVSGQVNCYDFNKNYIGTIDYGKNTDHFEEGNVGADTNLRFRTFTPLDGTVYIRVCGGINRPKMVTPFFSPMDYGAKAQNLPYLQTFHKWGLNAAMFGDSIMLGRDGNSSAILEKNSVWWVNQLTNLNADNFGVGSMGWVSTRYLSEIAYDKISTTDITGYDLIVLCYGVNDTGSTLGSWDSTDETTIMGQVNKCIRYIGSVNPSARIILIAPWNTPGSGTFPDWGYSVQRYGGLTRYDLSNSLKRAAEYYKIGFISQIDSPLNGFGLGTAEGIANGPFAGTDGVHPTQEGYAAIGYWLSAKISAIQTESTIPSEDIANLKSAVAPEANFNFVHVISTQQPAPYNALSTVFDCGLYGVRGSEGYMPADAPAGFSGGSLLILPAYQERTTQGTPLNQTQKIQMLIDPVNKKIWMRYANASNTWRDWFVADMSMPVTALATATPNANGFTSSSFVAGGISEAGGNSSNSHRIRSVYIAKDDKTSIRYVIPDGYRLQIAFYSNNSGTQVGRTNWITGDGRIGFPEGCNYFRLQFASIDDATDLTSAADYNRISIEYGYELIDYSPFITTQTRWLALGDSITYGVCSSGASASSEGTSWAAFLAASLGYVFKNMGVRGMGYVTSGSNGVTWANTLDNIDALTDDYNLITIMLGINDYNNSNATLDNIADALNTGITRIITKYPNARLVVFTPFNARNRGTADTLYDYGFAFPESNPRTLKDIADKIGEVCDSRGIEWHNVSNGCLLNPSNMTGLLLDSIHPSQDCHKLLSKAMARYLIY